MEISTTNRNRVTRVAACGAALITAAVGLFWAAGCGGGSGSGGGSVVGLGNGSVSPVTASGKVILPTGSKLSLSSLTVNTGIDTEKVGANGVFTVRVLGTGACQVLLEDPNQNVVLTGYVDGGPAGNSQYAGGNGEISPTQTAVNLLFLGSGAFLEVPGSTSKILAGLTTASQTVSLASLISTRVGSNPLAISSGDSQIYSAVKSAATNMLSAATPYQASAASWRTGGAPSGTKAVQMMQVTVTKPATGGAAGVIVYPTTAQSGITVLNSSTSLPAISFQNVWRRRCAALVYETAVQPDGGELTPINPKPVGGLNAGLLPIMYPGVLATAPAVLPIEIQPSNALSGTFGSVVDRWYGNVAFSPVTTGPFTLTPEPNSMATVYTIVIIGPGSNNLSDALPPALSTLGAYVQDWKNTLAAVELEQMVLDLALPLLSSLPIPEDVTEQLGGSVRVDVIQDIVGALPGLPGLISSLKAGDFEGVKDSIYQNLIDSASWRDRLATKVVTSIYKGTVYEAKQDIARVAKNLDKASELLGFVDFLLELTDYATVMHDSLAGVAMEYCTATLSGAGPCGALPNPTVSEFFSATLNKTTFYGGQTGTCTISTGPTQSKGLAFLYAEFEWPSADNPQITNVKLDGTVVYPTYDAQDNSIIIKLDDPGGAEAHTITFTCGDPITYTGYPALPVSTTICGLLIRVVSGDAEWGASNAYFNLLPAAQSASPKFSSVAEQVQWEMGRGSAKE